MKPVAKRRVGDDLELCHVNEGRRLHACCLCGDSIRVGTPEWPARDSTDPVKPVNIIRVDDVVLYRHEDAGRDARHRVRQAIHVGSAGGARVFCVGRHFLH